MKHLFIAGNWKSNKTVSESEEWIKTMSIAYRAWSINNEAVTVVLCAPFTALYVLKQKIAEAKIPIALGAQDVSPFKEGAYTGEVTARMIKEVADWVLIGHSERRKLFGETDEMLEKKVTQARDAGLNIIYCVPDDLTFVPAGVSVVAYEPVWAIGTGKTDTPENANTVISVIKERTHAATVIYGGSVTAENVASFSRMPAIDGVLPGGASLNAETFANLIASAQ